MKFYFFCEMKKDINLQNFLLNFYLLWPRIPRIYFQENFYLKNRKIYPGYPRIPRIPRIYFRRNNLYISWVYFKKEHLKEFSDSSIQTILLMDNVPYRKSKIVYDFIKNSRASIITITLYCPSLNPAAKIIMWIKQKLKRHMNGNVWFIDCKNWIEF